jgi:all-trans-retinol 13,14-reductase
MRKNLKLFEKKINLSYIFDSMNSRKYDIIIIGGGLGGLLCGSFLSQKGYKIAIFEKHKHIGGNLQGFYRKNCYFDTGMHYVGNWKAGSILYDLFEHFGVNKLVEISELDQNQYETVTISGKEYRLANGFEAYYQRLIEYFPNEISGISKYVETIKKVYFSLTIKSLTESIFDNPYLSQSAAEFIDSCTENIELRALLASNAMLYAGERETCSLYIHAVITGFYIQGAGRFSGGSSIFAEKMSDFIKSNSGEVFLAQQINRFSTEKNKILSCFDNDNNEYFADQFIWAVHPSEIFKSLPENFLGKVYQQRIENLRNTMGFFSIYCIMKKERFPYFNFNHYIFDNHNVWIENESDKMICPNSYLMLSSSDEENPFYARTIKILAYIPNEEISRWNETLKKKRGAEYEQFKQEKAEKIIQFLNHKFPSFKESIEEIYTSTSLTFRDYTATPQGTAYGVVRDYRFQAASYIPVRTKGQNLFLTGQNINLHGILGVAAAAFLTCNEIHNTRL